MKKAYLIDVYSMIRVIAENEEQATEIALKEVRENGDLYLGSADTEVNEDFDSPYDPETDENTPTPADQDQNPTTRLYSNLGINEILNFRAILKDGSFMNENEFIETAENQIGDEVTAGDIVTITYINNSATEAEVYAYVVNQNFMGSYDISFYGKRIHKF
jgi:hypothetical protein